MKYSEIYIGLAKEIKHKITTKDIDKFIDLTGDDNKLHIDKDFASKTKFKQPVVHGMLGASFISAVIGTKLPGDGALWFSQSIEFVLPVRVNDSLTIRAEVIKMEDREQIIHLKIEIKNQKRQIVIKGTSKVQLVSPIVEEKKDQRKLNKKAKSVLVVGASGEIGSAVALALAKDGFEVALHYFSNLDRVKGIKKKIDAEGINSRIYQCDITNDLEVAEFCQDLISDLGNLDVMINCSTARITDIQFEKLDWNDINEHFTNQIKGNFNLCKHLVDKFKKQKSGKIITLNSQALDAPVSNWLHYITGKGALYGFTKALAYELAPHGIQVNSISPGLTDTNIIADLPEKVKLLMIAKTPLRKIANPDDIANLAVFLSSDKANYFCGETFRLNGGQYMV